MIIQMSNVMCALVKATELEERWLFSYLSFPDDRARFQRRRWGDGKIHMMSQATRMFAAGYIGAVKRAAAKEKIKVEIQDLRTIPCKLDLSANISWLRDYQDESIEIAIKEERGVFHHATGCLAGDTVIGVHRAGKSYKLSLRDLYLRENRINSHSAARLDPSIKTRVQYRDAEGVVRLGDLDAVVSSGKKALFELSLVDGRKIKATRDHKFLAETGWFRLGQLHPGDKVCVRCFSRSKGSGKDTVLVEIKSIAVCGTEETFDICMKAEPHNFIANDFVVHNSGKTEVWCALTQVFPCRHLFLTHSKDLLKQTWDRLKKRTGYEAGWVGEGKFQPKDITVATIQTIYRGLVQKKASMIKFLDSVQAVAVDECHRTPAITFYRVIMSLKNAYWRYGFSGTPFARGDRKSIYTWGALGPIIHRIAAEKLIEEGVLAKPKIKMLRMQHGILNTKTWAEAYKAGITENVVRNDKIIRIACVATKPCLLFVKELAHGKYLERVLRRKGINVEFVWGKHKVAVRQAAIRRLVHGTNDVLICNVIFQEGIDIPELQSVIIASGGKSIIVALQDVGRGMRRHDRDGKVTKTEFEVWDIADRGCGCKSPNKHRGCKWLEKHTRSRIKAFASEAYEVVEVQSI